MADKGTGSALTADAASSLPPPQFLRVILRVRPRRVSTTENHPLSLLALYSLKNRNVAALLRQNELFQRRVSTALRSEIRS